MLDPTDTLLQEILSGFDPTEKDPQRHRESLSAIIENPENLEKLVNIEGYRAQELYVALLAYGAPDADVKKLRMAVNAKKLELVTNPPPGISYIEDPPFDDSPSLESEIERPSKASKTLTPTYRTLCNILRRDDKGQIFHGKKIEYSLMDETPTIGRVQFTDAMTGHIRVVIEDQYPFKGNPHMGLCYSKATVNEAMEYISHEHEFHEAQEHYHKLPPWDGDRKLARVLSEILGVNMDIDDEWPEEDKKRMRARNLLAQAQIEKFFISVVARTMSPGCQVDTMLILKGTQGRQKSTFFRTICPEGRFSDDDIDLRNKDTLLLLRKVTIYEWSELAVMRSARDEQTVKSFVSRRVDSFRPPFASRVIERPRHCVIVGTTNDDDFLNDKTGDRRYWIIDIGDHKIDLEKTLAWKDQLWAEALQLYRNEVKWHLDDEQEALRAEVNSKYHPVDPWEPTIKDLLDNAEKRVRMGTPQGAHPGALIDIYAVKVSAIFDELGINVSARRKTDEIRIAGILKHLGYKQSYDKHRNRCWRKEKSLKAMRGGAGTAGNAGSNGSAGNAGSNGSVGTAGNAVPPGDTSGTGNTGTDGTPGK